jgi:5-methylcytosine-specific restriction endonuclease McrA
MRRKEYSRMLRAAKWGVVEHFTPYQIGRVRKQFGRKCFKCGKARKLHMDHHRPLSAGYALAYGNAVVLCRKCNLSKGWLMPEDFYTPAELARLQPYLDEQLVWESKRHKK